MPRRFGTQQAGNIEARGQTVFVETITRPCSTVPDALDALNFVNAGLSGNGGLVILWVGIAVAAKHCFGAGRFGGIQCHKDRLGPVDILQNIHPISQADRLVGIILLQHVPRRPGLFALRHQLGVAMQPDIVVLIADGPEYGAF